MDITIIITIISVLAYQWHKGYQQRKELETLALRAKIRTLELQLKYPNQNIERMGD